MYVHRQVNAQIFIRQRQKCLPGPFKRIVIGMPFGTPFKVRIPKNLGAGLDSPSFSMKIRLLAAKTYI